MSTLKKVLAITLEPISTRMAGPAIRCVELAKQIATAADVTVFSPRPSDLTSSEISSSPNFHLMAGSSKSELYQLARDSDVLFIQGNVLKAYPLLARLDKYVVVDLYDPFLLAILAQFEKDSPSAYASYNLMHQVLEQHMSIADFSVCASERQRDYWLGRYCALGRLTPELYDVDRSFRKLIDVVPFGLPESLPVQVAHGIKGAVPGINKDDFVLLWGGGIWEWFDPLTIIKAVAKVAEQRPTVKLYFLGFKSPNPQVPLMQMAVRSKELAAELNVLDKNVFFSDSWTSYEDRVNFLLDADATVSAHFDLPETRFSFRTRILDYLWAGRPVLTTCGDQFADMIQTAGAGSSLPYEDVSAWANAITQLIDNENLRAQYQQAASRLAEQFRWNLVAKPLVEYCRSPHHLPKYRKVKMPTLMERAKAVYSRGGKDLVMKRSKELLDDIIRR